MKSILAQTKTTALNLDAMNTAQRITPAQSRRTPAGQWDLFAIIGLMVCSAAYSVCAITQMTGLQRPPALLRIGAR